MARTKGKDDLVIRWRPQPRQLAFLQSCGLAHWFGGGGPSPPVSRLIGFGGAAGGGKSDALLMAAVSACLTYAGAQVGYFRRTFPELEGPGGAIQRAQRLLADLQRLRAVKWQGQQHRWLFANGSVLQFCHAENEDSVFKYQSLQFDVIVIDEGTHFTEPMVQYLMTRNRLTVNMPGPIFAIGTNPGGPGHHWFRRLFVQAGPAESVNAAMLETKPVTTFFVPSKLSDNYALESRDPEYRRTLEAMPEHLRKQLLEGDWEAFAGQMFATFDPEIHIVEPFKIPKHWRRWRSNDPGFTDPFCWHWFAADEDSNVYIYREYTRGRNDPRVPYSEQAAEAVHRSVSGPEVPGGKPEVEWNEDRQEYLAVQENLDYTCAGLDAFTKHPESGKSIVDFYNDSGVTNCIEPVHGAGARAHMAATVHEYLKPFPGPDGKPTAKLKIFRSCNRLIETLPMLTADEHKPEQVAESTIDHWYQCAGYGLQSHHAAHSEPVKRIPTRFDQLLDHKRQLAKKLSRRRRWG